MELFDVNQDTPIMDELPMTEGVVEPLIGLCRKCLNTGFLHKYFIDEGKLIIEGIATYADGDQRRLRKCDCKLEGVNF